MRVLLSGLLACVLWVGVLGQPPQRGRICVDPGHISEIGAGTSGKSITELELCWKVAERVISSLRKEGFEVVATKSSLRQKVTNRKRANIANEFKADLMIRLHADYAPGERGFATFFADRQGTHEKVTGPSNPVLKQVKPMAAAFHRAAVAALNGQLKDRGCRTEQKTKIGAERGALIGSIHANMPSILVEMVVLNDAKDDRFAASEKGQIALAKAIVAGVKAALVARVPARPTQTPE